MIEGGCLCGGVRYQYTAELQDVVVCHCQQCKKAQGSAFAVNAPIRQEFFTLLSGQQLLREYRHSPFKSRVFCENCGSALYSQRDDTPDLIRLRLGTLDTIDIPAPNYHIHHENAVDWCRFDESQPRYPVAKPVLY